MNHRRLALIGSGGLGRETLWALQARKVAGGSDRPEVAGFVTCRESEHGSEVCGVPVLGPEDWLIGKDVEAVCCVGDPRARRDIVTRLESDGVSFATVVHPSAVMSDYVEIGAGSIIGARAVLTTQVEIAHQVIVGVSAVVSHDCHIEAFATLAPGVLLAGNVRVEYGAELGVGATVLPERTVGRGALVGGHSTVVQDVPANAVVAGTPAKRTRDFSSEESM